MSKFPKKKKAKKIKSKAKVASDKGGSADDGKRTRAAEGGKYVEEQMTEYGLYVLEDRTTPRVEDGLKTVQRRILWTTHSMGSSGRNWTKCAEIYGAVIGQFHPHGDMGVYGALVNMHHAPLQLIEGHGNFGDKDTDDPPASGRYTEAKLGDNVRALALDTPDLECVPTVPSYNNKREEPIFLPMRLPVLLLQGCESIGVGQGVHIPPFNLKEVINAALIGFRTGNWKLAAKKIKGPDYGRGQLLSPRKEIKRMMAKGQGTLEYSCSYAFEVQGTGKSAEKKLVITSLAPDFKTPKLLEKLADLRNDGVISRVEEGGNEDNLRIEISFENAALVQKRVLPLLRNKQTYSFNVLAPKSDDLYKMYKVNAGRKISDLEGKVDVKTDPRAIRPLRASVAQILEIWATSRRAVFEATLEKRRASIQVDLEKEMGKALARKNIDKLLDIVKSGEEMIPALVNKLKLTQLQAETVAAMRVDALQKSSQEKIEAGIEVLRSKLAETEAQLKDIPGTLVKQIEALRREFSKNKRTKHLLARGTALSGADESTNADSASIDAMRSPLKGAAWRAMSMVTFADPKKPPADVQGKAPTGIAHYRDQLTLVFADRTAVQLAANAVEKKIEKLVGRKGKPLVAVLGDDGSDALYIVDDFGRGVSLHSPVNVAVGEEFEALKGEREAKAAVAYSASKDTIVIRQADGSLVCLPPGSTKPAAKAYKARAVGRMLSKDIKGIYVLRPGDKLVSDQGKVIKLPDPADGERAGRRELSLSAAKTLTVKRASK